MVTSLFFLTCVLAIFGVLNYNEAKELKVELDVLKAKEITEQEAIQALEKIGCRINKFDGDSGELQNAINVIGRYADSYFGERENEMELRTQLAQSVLDTLNLNYRTEQRETTK